MKQIASKTKSKQTEDELDSKLEFWSQQIVNTISDLFNDKIDRIATTQDKILKKLETWEQENEVGANQIHDLRVKTDDHERRIKLLESAKN